MDSTSSNLFYFFQLSTSLFAGLILLGLIIWGYFKTKNPGYIIIGVANILHVLFQLVRVIIMMFGFVLLFYINIFLGNLNFILFFILVIGLIVLIVKSEKRRI